MIKSTVSKNAVSASADEVRLLFTDPSTATPFLHLPSLTAHAILLAEGRLIDVIDNNPPPGYINKATRWSSIVGLVVLERVRRALGVDQEMTILAPMPTQAAPIGYRSSPVLPSASNSSRNSNSDGFCQRQSTSTDTTSTSATFPTAHTKAIALTTATVHITGAPPMTPSTSTIRRRARKTSNTNSIPISAPPTRTTSTCSNFTNNSLRRSDGQRILTSVHSGASTMHPLSASAASAHHRSPATPATPEHQEASKNESAHTSHHHHHHHPTYPPYHYHALSPSPSPPLHDPVPSHQSGIPVPFATLSPVLAFERTCSTPQSSSSANASQASPFKRTCCKQQPAQQHRQWR